jgi:hypothetical protein
VQETGTGGDSGSIVVSVHAPRRVLIDWDFAGHGIWTILSTEELHAPAPPGRWGSAPSAARQRARPWSDLLSIALLDALQEWNDTGETLLGRHPEPDGAQHDAFWALAAELAERTQQELGAGYEVLHLTPGGAWRWVRPRPNPT